MPPGSSVHAFVQKRSSVATSAPTTAAPQLKSRSPIKLERRPKSEQYQSVFDTDVDSIGDSTTFSLVDDDVLPASASDISQDWPRSQKNETTGFNFVHHRADSRHFSALNAIRTSVALSAKDRNQPGPSAQDTVTNQSRRENDLSIPANDRLIRERSRFQSERSHADPTTSKADNLLYTDDEHIPDSDQSSSPTPRRRPILMRGPIRSPVFQAPAPPLPFHRKRSHDAVAQTMVEASDEDPWPPLNEEDHDPLTEASTLNHTNTSVSLDSTPGSGQLEDIDYDPDILASISYTDLASQPFDLDPNIPLDHTARSPLSADRIADEIGGIRRQSAESPENQQEQFRAFFSRLDIDGHEVAGDVIMDKMAEALRDLKKCRRDKRTAALELEQVVTRREERVRESEEALGRSMEWLRKQGQGVVRGPK